MPFLGLILGSVGLFVGISGWLLLCGGASKPGWRGVCGALALQISAVCLIYGVLRGSPDNGLFMALFPPLEVVELAQFGRYTRFMTLLAAGIAPYAVVVLVLCLAWRPLRRWSLVLTATAAMAAALFVGDHTNGPFN